MQREERLPVPQAAGTPLAVTFPYSAQEARGELVARSVDALNTSGSAIRVAEDTLKVPEGEKRENNVDTHPGEPVLSRSPTPGACSHLCARPAGSSGMNEARPAFAVCSDSSNTLLTHGGHLPSPTLSRVPGRKTNRTLSLRQTSEGLSTCTPLPAPSQAFLPWHPVPYTPLLLFTAAQVAWHLGCFNATSTPSTLLLHREGLHHRLHSRAGPPCPSWLAQRDPALSGEVWPFLGDSLPGFISICHVWLCCS